ncbi:MAG: MBL fold metallo-hydrolase [Clostridia bacterium]|nr:MBL fold metallo-hydrolase [Clostridia bacterium]
MKLTVLGKYGPYPKTGAKTSGYLLNAAGENISFEMGSGVFSALSEKISPQDLSAVIISHFHYDHISDLGVFNYYLESLSRRGELKCNSRLIVPDADCPELSAIRRLKYFDVQAVNGGDTVLIGDVKFTFFEVKHPVPCLGFRCEAEEKTFVYSGDTDTCEELEKNVSGADMLLADGAFLSRDYRAGGPHMSVGECARIAREHGVKTLISHLLPTVGESDYAGEIKAEPLCLIAEEGKTYFI